MTYNAHPKSQHICGRTKRDWLKCHDHDCFILDHITNHWSQTGWWWSNMWANIDKKEGVWGSNLRFKLRTNPSGGVWANKNLGITNTVGVDIWESGWLENKISLTAYFRNGPMRKRDDAEKFSTSRIIVPTPTVKVATSAIGNLGAISPSSIVLTTLHLLLRCWLVADYYWLLLLTRLSQTSTGGGICTNEGIVT